LSCCEFFILSFLWQKRSKELKEGEERFASVIESLLHIILEMDAAGNLTFVNHRALEYFG
jgi:PAS domain-containing protein